MGGSWTEPVDPMGGKLGVDIAGRSDVVEVEGTGEEAAEEDEALKLCRASAASWISDMVSERRLDEDDGKKRSLCWANNNLKGLSCGNPSQQRIFNPPVSYDYASRGFPSLGLAVQCHAVSHR